VLDLKPIVNDFFNLMKIIKFKYIMSVVWNRKWKFI